MGFHPPRTSGLVLLTYTPKEGRAGTTLGRLVNSTLTLRVRGLKIAAEVVRMKKLCTLATFAAITFASSAFAGTFAPQTPSMTAQQTAHLHALYDHPRTQ